ncbi:hypothetical protein AB0I53_32530 [Saccharopolyspora sp. NPDC050389]|uniref:hypothetical protein n=1 Tax=Saccharopolyspora sp. NPDC050389 TaxID=3155516 RepID=UPI00340D59B1
MFGKREAHLVVLNDLDEAWEAVRRAVHDASPEELPGLQRALKILDEAGDGEPQEIRWTRQVLTRAGIDPRTHEVAAVREVRKQLPGLSLASAVGLVRQVKG